MMGGFQFGLLGVTAALVLGLGIAACTDRSSSFNPQSVPGNKPLDELDPTEQEAFCDEAAEWAVDIINNSLPRVVCFSEAVQAGSMGASGFDVGACNAAQDACVARPAGDDELSEGDLSCDFSELDPACTATVSEFAECFEEAASLLNRLAGALTCENVASGNVPNEADYQISARCQALFDDCGGASDQSTSGPVTDSDDGGSDSATDGGGGSSG